MSDEKGSNMKLGLFVLAATVILVLALYLMGSKKDMFSRSIDITAVFREVNGLRKGNNVRYAGIDVGTVKTIEIRSDTELVVHFVVRLDAAKFIRKDALTRIGSDGLMGNKLLSIEPGEGQGLPIEEGDVLHAAEALDTEAMLRTLGRSNDNLEAITTDLRGLTTRLSSSNSVLSVLNDSAMVNNVQGAMNDLRATASNARRITERIDAVVLDVRQGKGALGALVNDPLAEQQVRQLMLNLQQVSDTLNVVTQQFGQFSQGLNDRSGTVGILLHDTAMAMDLRRVIANMDTSSATLNEDLKALQRNFLLRKYFREKKRKEAK
jgi:phospholipid/cholesterol/gamma-HCH transport system substrate-binding protein